MATEPEFAPLQARRLARPAPAEDVSHPPILADEAPDVAVCGPDLLRSANDKETDVGLQCDVESEERNADDLQIAAQLQNSPFAAPLDADSGEVDAPAIDEHAQLELLRSEATRFAAIACARALRVSLAEDPARIVHFVDDALRACGRTDHRRVRLAPLDAAAYRPQRDVDVTIDVMLERGEVAVDTGYGEIRATLEQRAQLLVKAAADA